MERCPLTWSPAVRDARASICTARACPGGPLCPPSSKSLQHRFSSACVGTIGGISHWLGSCQLFRGRTDNTTTWPAVQARFAWNDASFSHLTMHSSFSCCCLSSRLACPLSAMIPLPGVCNRPGEICAIIPQTTYLVSSVWWMNYDQTATPWSLSTTPPPSALSVANGLALGSTFSYAARPRPNCPTGICDAGINASVYRV